MSGLSAAVMGRNYPDFAPKDLREMTWACVADFQSHLDHALFRLPQQAACFFHAHPNEITRRSKTSGPLEQPAKVKFADASFTGLRNCFAQDPNRFSKGARDGCGFVRHIAPKVQEWTETTSS